MAVKKIGKTWEELLSDYTPFAEKAGRLAASIQEILANNQIPWIRIEVPFYAEFLLQTISSELKKNLVGYVLKDNYSVSDLENIDLAGTSSVKSYQIKIGMDIKEVQEIVAASGLECVNKVWSEGEYSIVGDIMSLWLSGRDYPVRIEFFGNKVESMSEVDVETRRAIGKITQLTVFINEFGHSDIGAYFDQITANTQEKTEKQPIFFAPEAVLSGELNSNIRVIDVDFTPVVWEEKAVKQLIAGGWKVWLIVSKHLENANALRQTFPDLKIFEDFAGEGFKSKELGLIVFSDSELWGTLRLTGNKFGDKKYTDLLLQEINPGDYVVHEDHGVGIYSGIKESEKDGHIVKYLELHYAKKDRLLVPLTQIKKVTKYVGVGTKIPVLTRLGGGEWNRVKARVSKAVEKIASELLRLYALREMTKITPFKETDGQLQKFEDDFEFIETEDQLRAIAEIKTDLKAPKPMDRVLVGDVGFGKTEIAMRAAFIAVQSGKQVAVLAPTTILVEQHYQVFKDRMEKYGINVAALSRFLDKNRAEQIVADVEKGKVDVIIGTHRLLSKDVQFKNLGLIIVDEEQKFGVVQKEKLKSLRVDSHVLSMSATPIPRTLNMALSGVRDISVIATPPEGRKPIENIVEKFDWKSVKEAISNEVGRKGQVYFVHNRVETINFVKQKLEELLPGVRFSVAHGQQTPEMLSRVMREFNEGLYDVLICTTIIENGLDMPNVNTLIVDRAEMFGLSQLYQLRGRIGRGKRQAYAYFFYYGTGYGTGSGRVVKKVFEEAQKEEMSGEIETLADAWAEEILTGKKAEDHADEANLTANKILWRAARMRLDAIRQLKELGAGFQLAQKDLEIRGAGNFLGKEQHGNVEAIGFSLYCRLLDETINKMKKKVQKPGNGADRCINNKNVKIG